MINPKALDALVKMSFCQYKWRVIRLNIYFIYGGWLSNLEIVDMFDYHYKTVVNYRRKHGVPSLTNPWKNTPPKTPPKEMILACKLYVTGRMELSDIVKEVGVDQKELEEILFN